MLQIEDDGTTQRWNRDLDAVKGTVYIGHIKDDNARLSAFKLLYETAALWVKEPNAGKREDLLLDMVIYASRAAYNVRRYNPNNDVTLLRDSMGKWGIEYLPVDPNERVLMKALLNTNSGNGKIDNDVDQAILSTKLRLVQYKKK